MSIAGPAEEESQGGTQAVLFLEAPQVIRWAARLEKHFQNWVSGLFHFEIVIGLMFLINRMEQSGMECFGIVKLGSWTTP